MFLIELMLLAVITLAVVILLRPSKVNSAKPLPRLQVTFIRHGESEGNIAHIINDDPKRLVPLTVRGQEQAAALGRSLQNEPFTHAYVSEFPRAQQTMAYLLQNRTIPLTVDARLNERKSGMDGHPVDAFNDQVLRDPLNFKTPQGESFIEQMQRLESFLLEISARHPQGKFLVVSHENPILAALGLVKGAETVVLDHIDNCGRVDLYVTPAVANGEQRFFTTPV